MVKKHDLVNQLDEAKGLKIRDDESDPASEDGGIFGEYDPEHDEFGLSEDEDAPVASKSKNKAKFEKIETKKPKKAKKGGFFDIFNE